MSTTNDNVQRPVDRGTETGESLNYSTYLQLDKLLDCQKMRTTSAHVHDEHLLIVTHQAYELWFKQIVFELDSIREIFTAPIVSEKLTLAINTRLDRIARILKLLGDQFTILETMTPFDFVHFRSLLKAASGFQSLQFRLFENKFGVVHENRINYNGRDYKAAFADERSKEALKESEEQLSLFDLVAVQNAAARLLHGLSRQSRITPALQLRCCLQRWLERTPGLSDSYFNFWQKYKATVKRWLDDCYLEPARNEAKEDVKRNKMAAYEKYKDTFDEVLNEDHYNAALQRHDRRLSYLAFQGAMMISLYRDEPRFHQPFQILTTLCDIDSLFTKWRYNHVMLVQRMIGSRLGTGSSSGHQYLQSTISDRYKVFVDLLNMSTYLVPREYSPQLTQRMQRCLSVTAMGKRVQDELEFEDDYDDDDDNADETTKNLIKLHIY